jgi:hypothetical protein
MKFSSSKGTMGVDGAGITVVKRYFPGAAANRKDC